RRDPRTELERGVPPTPPELIAIPPRCELQPPRRSDLHELEPLWQSRNPDVVGRETKPGAGEQTLAGIDRFEPAVERHEIPLLAPATDHPETALHRIECHAASDRQRLEHVVAPQVATAVETGGVHQPTRKRISPRGYRATARSRSARFSRFASIG